MMGLERWSVKWFWSPLTWRMSVVNSEIYDRGLSCRGVRVVAVGMTSERDLWSVKTANFLPSTMCRKCWIASLIPRSSLSKAEYLRCAVDSFLEKNPKGLSSS